MWACVFDIRLTHMQTPIHRWTHTKFNHFNGIFGIELENGGTRRSRKHRIFVFLRIFFLLHETIEFKQLARAVTSISSAATITKNHILQIKSYWHSTFDFFSTTTANDRLLIHLMFFVFVLARIVVGWASFFYLLTDTFVSTSLESMCDTLLLIICKGCYAHMRKRSKTKIYHANS